MSTPAPGGNIRAFPKVASITPMGPRQKYHGPDRREHERREDGHAAKPVTRIQSFLQHLVTIGAVVAVGLSIHQAGKNDENRLTRLENNETRSIQIMEEQTKTNKMLIDTIKSDAEDKILMLERLIRIETDREKREELREALKRAKAKRLQGAAPKLDFADSSVIGGLPQ
jgi:hypothetical protein